MATITVVTYVKYIETHVFISTPVEAAELDRLFRWNALWYRLSLAPPLWPTWGRTLCDPEGCCYTIFNILLFPISLLIYIMCWFSGLLGKLLTFVLIIPLWSYLNQYHCHSLYYEWKGHPEVVDLYFERSLNYSFDPYYIVSPAMQKFIESHEPTEEDLQRHIQQQLQQPQMQLQQPPNVVIQMGVPPPQQPQQYGGQYVAQQPPQYIVLPSQPPIANNNSAPLAGQNLSPASVMPVR